VGVVINAGELDQQVAIQSDSSVRTADGSFDTPSWTTDETVWARIRTESGGESLQAGAVNSTITHTVTIRYSTTPTTAKRLLWGTRALGIVSIENPEAANVITVLKCKEDADA